MRAFPRLTLPLIVSIMLALPLAACGETTTDDAAVADLDDKLTGKGRYRTKTNPVICGMR